MKNNRFLELFVLIFVLLGVMPLVAQNQEGSVKIAESIRPEDEDATFSNFSKCVTDLKTTGTGDKAAIEACTKIAKITANTAKKIANEAADATKASRPMIVGGYGPYYHSYGSSYRSFVYGGYDGYHRGRRYHQRRYSRPPRRR